MLKLLYIPTGNTFTLPDEEALRIKKEGGANYKILDAGYQEEKVEKIEEKTIQELVMPNESEEEVELKPTEEITLEELEKMDRFALYGLAQRLDLKPNSQANKRTLLKLLKETGIFN